METTIEPYSPAWYTTRQGCFTGSEAWKLMTEPRSKKESISKTAETYILEKVWEKLSGKTKSGIDNFATEWGNEQEPNAVRFYEKLSGNTCQETTLIYSKELPYLIGTPDRYVGVDGMIEVKCPFNGANHLQHCFITTDEYFRDEFKEYYWQIQTYLYLSEREWCDFVSFDPRIDSELGLFIYRLKRDNEQIIRLKDKAIEAKILFDEFYKVFSSK